jgi:hypothetical protein
LLFGGGPAFATSLPDSGSSESAPNAQNGSSGTARAVTGTVTRALSQGIGASVGGTVARGITTQRGGRTALDSDVAEGTVPDGFVAWDDGEVALTGVSTGNGGPAYSLWATGNFQKFRVTPHGRDRERRTYAGALLIGGNVTLKDQFVIGTALGFSGGTTLGWESNGNHFDQHNTDFTVAPYAAYIVNDKIYVDASFGFTFSETSNSEANVHNVIAGRYHERDSETKFIAVNVNYMDRFAGFDILATAGYTWSKSLFEEVFDDYAFAGPDFNGIHPKFGIVNGQYRLGVQVGYPTQWDSTPVMPFGRVTYEHDKDVAGIGDDAARLAVGVDLGIAKAATLRFEGSALVGKDEQEEYGLAANLNLAF